MADNPALSRIVATVFRNNPDGSTTVRFGTSDEDAPNYLPIMEGWNYTVRLYRPRREIIDGTWAFPSVTPERSRVADHG